MHWIRRVLFLVLLAIAGVLAAAWINPLPGERATPAGIARNMAVHVPAADGTRIAVDVWLPAALAAGERVPALIEGTRYWRDVEVTLLGRVMSLFGAEAPGADPDEYPRYFNDRGYAYATVDVRGTGASFGVHDAEYSRREMADYARILDWIVAQPWSNGRVGAVGISYSGTTAELMTTTRHPALRAAAPLYADFDAQFHLVTPGGVYQPAFTSAWGDLVGAMDRNDVCGVATAFTGEPVEGVACFVSRMFMRGVKPVDGADGRILLEQAVAEHDSPDVAALVRTLEYRDSAWSAEGYSAMQALPYGRKNEIEASGVPLFVVAGWFDAATADGAVARFASFSNRQSVYLAPFSHGGGHDTDPYAAVDAEPVWPPEEQLARVESFFAAYLKDPAGEPPPRGLSYRVMGASEWKHTDRWPPAGFETRTYHLADDGTLSPSPVGDPGGADRYQVDFAVGTAPTTRWITQLDGGDVIYDRRASMQPQSLTYQTEPMDVDLELTGTPMLTLWLSSDNPQGAVHAYLEDVAPDGTVRYLSEGVLNLEHRRAGTLPPPYPTFGPYHSFLRADAVPMPVGSPERVTLGLYVTSALVRRGHRLRIAIAGADATSFARIPAEGPPPVWTVHRSAQYPSVLELPLRPWIPRA